MPPLLHRAARAVRRAVGLDRETRWNKEYAKGGWEWLDSLPELAHHSILAGYFTRLKPNGRVLDVGCGEGLFHERLTGRPYARYVGFDFAEAIKRAEGRADEKTSFIVADMNDFTTSEQFDAIVFNESIYYIWDIAEGLAHYERFLAPDGIFLISMHGKERNDEKWVVVESRYVVLDAVTVTNQHGTRWNVKALTRPPT
jgi:SAM-dependent methyltransferase